MDDVDYQNRLSWWCTRWDSRSFGGFWAWSGSARPRTRRKSARMHRRRRAIEFKKFLARIDARGASRPGRPPDLRQPVHPQDTRDHRLAGRPSPLPPALHPDQFVMAQPGRAMVRPAHRPGTTPRRAPIGAGIGEKHPRLGRRLERGPATVHMDQNRRPDPRTTRSIYTTNSRRGTLACCSGQLGCEFDRTGWCKRWASDVVDHPAFNESNSADAPLRVYIQLRGDSAQVYQAKLICRPRWVGRPIAEMLLSLTGG
jgi:hypothetical protein